jgi:hypothetical protein
MSDGMITNQHTVDSTSPMDPFFTFAPTENRRILQRQINHTVDQSVDRAMAFTQGNFDGRFIQNFPGTTISRENDDGYLFHIVGINRGGDLSVAAP